MKKNEKFLDQQSWLVGPRYAVGGAKIAKIHQKFDPYRHQMSQS